MIPYPQTLKEQPNKRREKIEIQFEKIVGLLNP
jgi:hypothetical protein